MMKRRRRGMGMHCASSWASGCGSLIYLVPGTFCCWNSQPTMLFSRARSVLHRRMTANHRPVWSDAITTNGRSRRILVIAGCSDEGRLTPKTDGAEVKKNEQLESLSKTVF